MGANRRARRKKNLVNQKKCQKNTKKRGGNYEQHAKKLCSMR